MPSLGVSFLGASLFVGFKGNQKGEPNRRGAKSRHVFPWPLGVWKDAQAKVKVSKGQPQPKKAAAAFLFLYIVLGSTILIPGILGVPSPFFPGILLFGKQSKTQGKQAAPGPLRNAPWFQGMAGGEGEGAQISPEGLT